jgi:hypothetical protein
LIWYIPSAADSGWADTLDLQDHNAPSAKDHSKHAVQTSEGTGLAPHQEQEIRHADHDSKAEMMHGPNGHGTHLDTDGYHDGIEIYDGTDDIHVGLGVHRDESEIRGRAEEGALSDEEEDDDLLDDDLLDKISSSPSINDDGMIFSKRLASTELRTESVVAILPMSFRFWSRDCC